MSAQENLDRKPGFWLTVIILLPFIIATELALWVRASR